MIQLKRLNFLLLAALWWGLGVLPGQRFSNVIPFVFRGLNMEPAVGVEPTTDGLQNRCSTTELSRRTGGS